MTPVLLRGSGKTLLIALMSAWQGYGKQLQYCVHHAKAYVLRPMCIDLQRKIQAIYRFLMYSYCEISKRMSDTAYCCLHQLFDRTNISFLLYSSRVCITDRTASRSWILLITILTSPLSPAVCLEGEIGSKDLHIASATLVMVISI